ncbi:MAG: glycosyltransferase family 2 protein [Phycisphaerae bacterium]|jgi:glycosyltransferase involved in cell wall biosynthesis
MAIAAVVFTWSWLAVWFWATLLIGLVWFRRHIDINRGRNEPILSDADATDAPGNLPRLTVLVAAKDEEANIARCLEGLIRQEYPNLQIIAIDDRSTDRTPAILDELAARHPHLTALHVDHLPPGWFGKNNAMRVGLEQATGELFCFTDADCQFDSPRLLHAAVSYARRHDVDLLSVLPHLETGTFWERVVQPVAGAVMVFWFPPQRVNSPRCSTAYANGAFMLMSRQTYEAIGGHEFARATLNEDMHMARQVKRVGRRLCVLRGGDMYRVRMYVGLRQIWRGWSRIFYGCFGTVPRLIGSAAMLSIFSLSPYITLLLSPLAGGAALAIAAAAAIAILAQQSILFRFYGLSGIAPAWALTYPLGAAFCLGMTLNAMTRLGGKQTTWRGTSYTGGAHASATPSDNNTPPQQ